MTYVDMILVLLLAVVAPVQGAYSFRRQVELARQGNPTPRTQLYLSTQYTEWTFFFALALLWAVEGRSLAALGFVTPGGTGFWIAVLVALTAAAYLLYARHSTQGMSENERSEVYEQFGDLKYFFPHTARDYRHFTALSLTAGWVEEIVYRGFLFWVFLPYMPHWGVVLVTSLIFCLGHSYQGINGMLRVFAIGLFFGALYVISGSIWVPIALHMLVDILQGSTLLELVPANLSERNDKGQVAS